MPTHAFELVEFAATKAALSDRPEVEARPPLIKPLDVGQIVPSVEAAFARLRALTDPLPVVVARAAIPPYTAITANMVEVAYLPAGAVTQPAYADPGAAVGRRKTCSRLARSRYSSQRVPPRSTARRKIRGRRSPSPEEWIVTRTRPSTPSPSWRTTPGRAAAGALAAEANFGALATFGTLAAFGAITALAGAPWRKAVLRWPVAELVA
mgnify:CR=1 FL=1